MKSWLKFICSLLIVYVAHEIAMSPLAAQPEPFWELRGEDQVSNGKLGAFLLLGGLVAMLLGGGLLIGLVKFLFGMLQHLIEGVVPRSWKTVAPVITLCCLLYPLSLYKSEVKGIGVATVMQVDLVLSMADEYSVKAKPVTRKVDV